MNKEKQIEEMAEIMRHSCENECFRNKDGFIDCEVCKACLLYEAGYRKVEWISVDERLPEDGDEVLIYGDKVGIYTACYDLGWGFYGFGDPNECSCIIIIPMSPIGCPFPMF